MCQICNATQSFDPARHEENYPLAQTINEGSDAANSIATSYRMDVGDSFAGAISVGGDQDWIAIDLVAGETYEFNQLGSSSGAGTLNDSYLSLHDSSGQIVDTDDDSGLGYEAKLTYTATYSGTYYISAGAFSAGTGSYTLTSATAAPVVASVGTLDELANYLTTGFSNGVERFWDTSASNVITVNLTQLTAEGQMLARWAMQAWEMVADLSFVETSGEAQIRLDDENSGAYAFSPNAGGADVNVSRDWLDFYGTDLDTYSFQTYTHEIGHALGLGHLGPYNGGGTFGSDNIFSNDSWQLSLMSYFSQVENTNVNASYGFAMTPMMADVVAIQNFYGAPEAGSATYGDTVWGFNSNLGNYLDTLFEFMLTGSDPNGYFTGAPTALTITDVNGSDVIDLSPSGENIRLDLRDETFSDLGALIGAIAIARGSVIENARLGTGNDTVTGNAANNSIEGGAGDDILSGGGGADTLFGGSGTDTLDPGAAEGGVELLAGGTESDTYRITGWGNTDYVITEEQSAGSNDQIIFSALNFSDVTLQQHEQAQLSLETTNGTVLLSNYGSTIERYEFADGVVLSGIQGFDPTSVPLDGFIVNGSFEYGYAGWATGGGQIPYLFSEGTLSSRTTDGGSALLLGGWSNAVGQWVEQRVATEAGIRYDLLFDAAAHTGAGAVELTVVDGSGNVTQTATISDDLVDGGMESYSQSFVATDNATTIRFTLTETVNGGDFDIDNIRLVAQTGFANGSFEQGGAGWTFGGGQPEAFLTASSGWVDRVSNGDRAVPLGAWTDNNGQWVEQTFNTAVDQIYDVAFDAGASGDWARLGVTVRDANGRLLLDETIDDNDGTNGFDRYSLDFLSVGPSSTVRFTLLDSATGSDFDLDNIALGQRAPIIVNGSFEQGSSGWLLGGGQPDAFLSASTGWWDRVAHGDRSMPLGGWSDSTGQWVEQTVSLEAGQGYRLSFDGAATASDATMRVNVYDANGETLVDTFLYDDLTDSGFEAFALDFLSTTSTARVRFSLDSAGTGADFDLDNIRIEEAPLLLENGSFEQGAVGWSFGGGQPAAFLRSSEGWWDRVSDGDQALPLGGWVDFAGQWVQQTVTTQEEDVYQLSFDGGTSGDWTQVHVTVRDQNEDLILDQTFVDSDGTDGFTRQTFDFLATGDASTIRFAMVDAAPGADYDLDNITLDGDAAILTNGSFERSTEGWQFGGGQPLAFLSADTGWWDRVSHGDQSVPLGGWSSASGQWVEQTATVTSGQSYRLSFDGAAEVGDATLRVNVFDAGGTTIVDQIVIDDLSDFGFETYSFDFVATDANARIRFTLETAENGADFDIDNVLLREIDPNAAVITPPPSNARETRVDLNADATTLAEQTDTFDFG